MRLKSGTHKGKTLEEVLLKHPDWARWMVQNHPDTPVGKTLKVLAKQFNAKPFTVECTNCTATATRASVYQNVGHELMFWCDDCDPYGSGAAQGKLTMVKTLKDALDHVEMTCNGRRQDKRAIVKELARGKGLSKRVGEPQALAFFNT